jgi:hypothetical protein
MVDNTSIAPSDGLKGVLAELAEKMGTPAGALRLVQNFGGLVIYVPGKPRPSQKIAKACGLDVARALASIRGNEQISIPDGLTDNIKQNRILKMNGSASQVARAVGCTVRHVRWVRAKYRKTKPLPLFERKT